MAGIGLIGIPVLGVLILCAAALIKYLCSK
jgi:hypothetical protein